MQTGLAKGVARGDMTASRDHNLIAIFADIACAEKDPVYIVMELMPGGALLDYLRKKGTHQPQKKLCCMAIDACKGMEYLEQNNCIHRWVN